MPHARTGRLVRTLRWTRALAHVGTAWVILRFAYPRSTRERRRELYSGWAGQLLDILAIERVVEGTPPEPGTGVMLAANHVSWVDIAAISSIRATRFIAKSEIRDWPVIGWVTERAGSLFVRRTRRHDTARINEQVNRALAEGDCVGLFPEGTTTDGDLLLRFHSSLFEPAVASGAVVVPVAIRYEHPDGSLCRAFGFGGELTFTQSIGLVMRQRRAVVRVSFAEPIHTVGLGRREVARLALERVASLLDLPLPGTAPRTPPGPPGEPR